MALNTSIRGAQIKEAFAGDGLTISGGVMSVGVDGTTITIVTDTLQANASALDHGTLAGLADIADHPYASLIDGTRDFTGIVEYSSHPTFVDDTDIVDKKYVDDAVVASGTIDHGDLLGLSDNDHTQYLMTGTAPLAVTGQDVALSLEATDLGVDGQNELYVIDSGIDHDATTNFVGNKHIDHTAVSISGGGILSGGGTIAANRTITLANSDIDHGGIGGLADDDHTQYSLVAGTRAFTGVVGGITPVSTADLTTKGYVDGLIQGLDWQESVLSITTEYGDAAASGTNRYIAPSTSGTWTDDYIYEWNGSSWTETVPTEGAAVWIEDTNSLKVYNGTDWVTFGSTINHNNLSGLQGGTGGEYYHLTNADHTWLTTNRVENIEDIVGGMVSGTQTNITVTYSDNAGAHGDLNYVVGTATTAVLGVASFVAADFDVAGGAVSLEDTVLKAITTDTGALTIAGHGISLLGGEGIDVTHVGTTISVIGEDATTANKGIASFDSNHFSVTAGAVSIVANGVDDTLIDWGSGAGQVSATDVPIDSGGSWAGSASNVQDALEELEAESTTLAFKTVAVAGQDDVVADAKDDTLTFTAGTDITITTNSGTDAITIASSGAGSITASLGCEKVGSDVRSDLLAAGGIKLTGNEIGIEPNDFAGAGLEDDGSDNLRIAAAAAGAGLTGGAGSALAVGAGTGITVNTDDVALAATAAGAGMTHTAGVLNVIGGNGITSNADDIELSSTVPGAGLTMTAGVINVIGGDGITASANEIETTVDGTTIELNASDGSGALRVKDLGITNAKIADDTIAEAKLDIHNAPVDTYYLQYDTTNGMQWTDVTSSGVTEADYRLENESALCNGATTAFTLDTTPISNSLQVYLNGLAQEKGVGKDYTHAGTTVTFVLAPLTNDILLIHYVAQS